MAEGVGVISSEVVLPESEYEQPDVPRAAKRRQSSSSDHSTKRARLSTDGDIDLASAIRTSPSNSPKAPESANQPKKDAIRERRQSDAQEERKRGRRLFGGLLNTLSQSASNTQQKRRLEIETRQQEKARLQKAEDESRRAERLQKLKEVRMREQVKFDEQSMRIRHSNMLAMAQFLSTKAEPKLYYKPWELLPGDAERIQNQVDETEALIEREVQEFKTRHGIEPRPEERSEESTNEPAEETVGEHRIDSSPVPPLAASDTNNPLPSSQAQAPDSGRLNKSAERDTLDENGEVIVEGDEDTVIY